MTVCLIANLPLAATWEAVQPLFTPFGEVAPELVDRKVHRRLWRYAFLHLHEDSLLPEVLAQVNGYVYRDLPLAVTRIEPRQPFDLTPERQTVIDYLIEMLQETEEKPRKVLANIVLWCGEHFATTILQEALAVYGAGGLLRRKGEQPRTLGGVFFYLVRPRLYWKLRPIILIKERPIKPPPPPPPPKKEKPPKAAPPPPVQKPVNPVTEKLRALRKQEKELKQTIEDVKAGKIPGKVFSLSKSLFEVQKQIQDVLRQNPGYR